MRTQRFYHPGLYNLRVLDENAEAFITEVVEVVAVPYPKVVMMICPFNQYASDAVKTYTPGEVWGQKWWDETMVHLTSNPKGGQVTTKADTLDEVLLYLERVPQEADQAYNPYNKSGLETIFGYEAILTPLIQIPQNL